jgi:hypothetical protein
MTFQTMGHFYGFSYLPGHPRNYMLLFQILISLLLVVEKLLGSYLGKPALLSHVCFVNMHVHF